MVVRLIIAHNRDDHHTNGRLFEQTTQYSTDALSPEYKNINILAYSNDNQIMYYM